MASLQERLDAFKKSFESGAPPYNAPHEAIETMHRATEELRQDSKSGHSRLTTTLPVSPYSIRITYR
jgi:hypothetical protein